MAKRFRRFYPFAGVTVFAVVAFAALLPGCRGVHQATGTGPQDWNSIQAAGGLAVGTPRRKENGHVVLPIDFDYSGTRQVTVPPTRPDSGHGCLPPMVRIDNTNVFITVAVGIGGNAQCSPADLGRLASGQYSVFYRSPDGSTNQIGSVVIQ